MTELEPVAEIVASLRRDMEASPVSGLTFLSRPQLEIIEASLTLSSAQSAIAERDARIEELERQPHYIYIGKDGKAVKARDLEERAEAAEALLKEAAEVLEPFSRYRTADGVTGMDGKTYLRIPDDHMLLGNMNNAGDLASVDPDTIVTVGHLRAARSLASKIGGGE